MISNPKVIKIPRPSNLVSTAGSSHNSPVHGLKAKALLQAAALVTEDIKGELAVVRSHSAVAHTSEGQSAH